MNARRTSIILHYTERTEVARGVVEDVLTDRTVKALNEQLFQSRQDQARKEGLILTARFRVRSNLFNGMLKYVTWNSGKYKVVSAIQDTTSHDTIIEIGELI